MTKQLPDISSGKAALLGEAIKMLEMYGYVWFRNQQALDAYVADRMAEELPFMVSRVVDDEGYVLIKQPRNLAEELELRAKLNAS